MGKGFDFLHQRTNSLTFSKEDDFLPGSVRSFYTIFETENILGNKFIDLEGDKGQIGALFFQHGEQVIYFNQFLSLDEMLSKD